jgi:plastocyanin
MGAAIAAFLVVPATTSFAQPAPASVSVSGTSFLPATIHVTTGGSVQWTNTSEDTHTVTADDGSFDSGDVAPGATFSTSFDTPGTYTYYCQYHGGPELDGMAATIIVDDPAAAPATTQRTGDDYIPTELP